MNLTIIQKKEDLREQLAIKNCLMQVPVLLHQKFRFRPETTETLSCTVTILLKLN